MDKSIPRNILGKEEESIAKFLWGQFYLQKFQKIVSVELLFN